MTDRNGAPIIRTAVPLDAAGIARVHIASWQTAYREIFLMPILIA